MPAFVDRSGQRFGSLVVGERADLPGLVHWKCVCDCGALTMVAANKLANGHTKSCGCLRARVVSEVNIRHGHSSYPNGGQATKEYNTWSMMRRRCAATEGDDFENYGSRGIVVCERWESFDNFLADMGLAPSPGHSIDRIKNDGNYEPGNCRWATAREQGRNKRTNRILECRGEKMTMVEWSERAGISNKRIHARLKRGWSVESAIFTPLSA